MSDCNNVCKNRHNHCTTKWVVIDRYNVSEGTRFFYSLSVTGCTKTGLFSLWTNILILMAKWLRCLPPNPGNVSSNPAVGKKNFSFCKSRFRSLQLEEAHANEINHDIHLANTLFQIKVRYKKYACRLQWFITVHVSFKIHISLPCSGVVYATPILKPCPLVLVFNNPKSTLVCLLL